MLITHALCIYTYMIHENDYCLYFSLEILQVAVDVIEVLIPSFVCFFS